MTWFLSEADVRAVLDMPSAIAAVEAAMVAQAQGQVVDLPRQRVRLPGSITHLLQGAIPELGLTGFKVYTSTREGTRFWVHVYDIDSGAPVAVLEADTLGMMRTGAAGGVAVKHLARQNALQVAVIGAGWQAEGQVRAIAAVRPEARFVVASRHTERCAAFCARLRADLGVPIEPAESVEAAVRAADIVVTATTSPTPVLDAAWLRPGMHINAIGSNSLARQELPEKAVRLANRIVVDSREVALREAGDLLPALEKGATRPGLWVELGEVIAGIRPGRQNDAEITLFESQGMAIQDIAVAAVVLERARAQGLGKELPW